MSGNSSNPWFSKIGQTMKLVTNILEVQDSNLRRNIADACCFREFPELLQAEAGIFSGSRAKRIFLFTRTSRQTLGHTKPPVQ